MYRERYKSELDNQFSQLQVYKSKEREEQNNSNLMERAKMEEMMKHSKNIMNQMENQRRNAERMIAIENLNKARLEKDRSSGLVYTSDNVRQNMFSNSRNNLRIQALTASPELRIPESQKVYQQRFIEYPNNSVERVRNHEYQTNEDLEGK